VEAHGIASVAVLGGGTMGGGIAGHLARAGLEVALADADPQLTRQARERLLARTREHVEAGLLDPAAGERTARVAVADGLEAAVAGAGLVIEAVPEDQALKEEVLERVGAAAPPEAIVATNTSSLPIAGLAGAIARPARFLGVHWFNPPEWTPGIEVIAGPDTSRAVVERVLDFMRAVGKRPAEVGDRAAFVSNRLQMALMREALACVEEGLVTREDLDEVVRSTFGFRLPFFGPFLIADMAGLDTYASVFRTLEREVGPAFAVPGALQELVDAGRVGTKSGEGFGTYSEADRDALLLERDRRYAALGALLADLPPPGVDADADRPPHADRPSPAQ
jgi:3-hydroxybutyryl-CoA dehydrogenase